MGKYWLKRRLGDLRFRLGSLMDRKGAELELEEEMAFHLAQEAEKYQKEGLSSEEAHRLARVRFGGVERQKERVRDSWGIRLISDISGNLHYSFRQVRRNPVFAIVAIVTLASISTDPQADNSRGPA